MDAQSPIHAPTTIKNGRDLNRYRSRLTLGAILGMLIWSLAAWWLTGQTARDLAKATTAVTHDELQFTADQMSQGIRRGLAVVHGIPSAVGQDQSLQKALERFATTDLPEPGTIEEKRQRWSRDPQLYPLHRWLSRFNNELGVSSVIWVMSSAGDTIASSNADSAESFVGNNFSDREYFQEAREGKSGRQFAVGRRTNVPGLYYSAPVVAGEKVIGVVVVKLDMTFLSSWVDQADALISDKYGVVILARDKYLEMRTLPNHTLGQLSYEERILRYKRDDFPGIPLFPTHAPGQEALHNLEGRPHPIMMHAIPIPDDGITLTVMAPVSRLKGLEQERIVWFLIAEIIGLLILSWGASRLWHQYQRSRDEQALRASEDKLATVFRASPIGIGILDLENLHLLDLNNAFAELFGWTRFQLLGRSAADLSLWGDADVENHVLIPLRQGQRISDWETSWNALGKSPKYLLWTTERIDLEGQPCFLALVMEITGRKRMEESLQQSNAMLEDRVNRRTVELHRSLEDLEKEVEERIKAEEQTRRAYVEQLALGEMLRMGLEPASMEEQLRAALASILALPWLNLLPHGGVCLLDDEFQQPRLVATHGLGETDGRDCLRVSNQSTCTCRRVVNTGRLVLYQNGEHSIDSKEAPPVICAILDTRDHLALPIRYKGNTLGVLKLFPVHTGELGEHEIEFLTGATRIMAGVITRKRAEETSQLATRIFSNTQEGILVTDRKNRIIDINPAFTHITQFTREEVLGRDPGFMKSGRHDAVFYSQMWKSIWENGSWQGEIWDRRKNGEIYPKWLTIDTLRDEKGEITHCIGSFADITKLKEAENHLEHLAHHDPLTGLANRNKFLPVLDQAIKNAQRWNQSIALLMFDLDRFKAVNDTLGHPAGDLLLQQVAQRIRQCLRESDVVARLGGDEFAIVMEHQAGWRDTMGVAQKVVDALAHPFDLNGQEARIAVSMGVAYFPHDAREQRELIRKADAASYYAKQRGGNSFHFYSPEIEQGVQERFQLENALAHDLEDGRFEVYYQPQIDPSSGQLGGIEALVRRRISVDQLDSPDQFLPLAEETGFIVPLGEWVLRTACQQAKAWLDAGMKIPKLAVNVSGRQFARKDFATRVIAIIEETGLPPTLLELELTESFLIKDMEASRKLMNTLRSMGIRMVLDDFGAGHSSFGYLRHFPLDGIKLPREYAADCTQNPFGASVSWAILTLAEQLGIPVVVEGLEREEEVSFFRGLSVDLIQGFFFARPMPPEKMDGFLRLMKEGESTPHGTC